jgi:plastocyanin
MVQRRGGAVRVVLGLLAVGGLIGYVGVAGAAEPAADAEIKTTTANTWEPADVSVNTGETVTWNFDGSTVDHNMHGETGPEAGWPDANSGFRRTGQYAYTFNTPGTYTFLCTAHPATMKGSVTVTGAPTTPTPSPSPSPSASPTPSASATPRPATPQPTVSALPTVSHDTPAPSGRARADRTAPVLSKASARRAGSRRMRVKWTLSERASLTLKVAKGKRVLRTVRVSGRPGTSALTIRSSRFKKGRYVVSISARDAAGNRSLAKRVKVRLKR